MRRLFLLGGGLLVQFSVWAQPDLILHNGRVVTVNARFAIEEAVAITGTRISAVGSGQALLETKGPKTTLVDLKGRTVIPGLIDSHTHPTGAAMTEFNHPIPEMSTMEDVLNYVRNRAAVTARGDPIVVQQVFITRLKEQRYPSRAELDRAAPEHPVFFRTGPDASLNSLALKAAGIDRNYRIPDGVAGRVEIDPSGEPTGILRHFDNYAKLPAGRAGRKATAEDEAARLSLLFSDYNSVGITSICDRDAGDDAIALYEMLHRSGALTLRVAISKHVDTSGPVAAIEESIRRVAAHARFKGGDDFLRIIGIKTYLGGGMLTGSAYMREPWGKSDIYAISDPDYRGVLFIPPEKLVPIVRRTVESGLQFTAHSVGDGAVHALLDAYEEVAKSTPLKAARPCITHCNFMSEQDVNRLAVLGVAADIQPIWLYMDGATLTRHFGQERMRWFQPLQSLFKAGAIIGGGSDHMQKIGALRAINPYHPFLGMQTTILRAARNASEPIHPEEKLTREQALRFYTVNNAYILFADDKVGSIEPGKYADLAVLNQDILSCPAEEIVKTAVLRTYVGGKLVFSQERAAAPTADPLAQVSNPSRNIRSVVAQSRQESVMETP